MAEGSSQTTFQGQISVLVEGSRCIALKSLPFTLESIRELQILRAVQGHPNIIKLLRAKLTATQVILYMEHHPRTLLDLISEFPDGLPLSRVRVIFHQILLGLKHIHKCGYLHHDIKLENILLDASDHVYLIDFGLSQPYIAGRYDSSHHAGSAHYAAPEIWLRKPYEGPEVDIWGAGICLFLLVTGFFPFGGPNNQEIWHSIRARELWKNDTLEKNMLLFDLLQRMLQFEHKHRITLTQVFQHPWFHCCERSSLTQSISAPSIDVAVQHSSDRLKQSRSMLDDLSLSPSQLHADINIVISELHPDKSAKKKHSSKERASKRSCRQRNRS